MTARSPTSLPLRGHLHPRRWVAPLAAFTMAIMLGIYVRSSIRQARRERDHLREFSSEAKAHKNDAAKPSQTDRFRSN